MFLGFTFQCESVLEFETVTIIEVYSMIEYSWIIGMGSRTDVGLTTKLIDTRIDR